MVLPAGVLLTKRICTKQNRCIRSMFFTNGREHVNPYYNLLGILRFENIYRLKVSIFTYKFNPVCASFLEGGGLQMPEQIIFSHLTIL